MHFIKELSLKTFNFIFLLRIMDIIFPFFRVNNTMFMELK